MCIRDSPKVTEEIVAGMQTYLEEQQIADIRELIGAVQ